MNILHILRSEPSQETMDLITRLSEGNDCRTINLFEDPVDYDELVELLFNSDRLFSWW